MTSPSQAHDPCLRNVGCIYTRNHTGYCSTFSPSSVPVPRPSEPAESSFDAAAWLDSVIAANAQPGAVVTVGVHLLREVAALIARRSSSSPSGVPRDISHEIEIDDGMDAKEQPNDIDRLLGLAHRAVRENRWGDAQMLIANIQHQRQVPSSEEAANSDTAVAFFDVLVDISMLTDLKGAVDDGVDVVKAVERLVAEKRQAEADRDRFEKDARKYCVGMDEAGVRYREAEEHIRDLSKQVRDAARVQGENRQ